MFHWKKIKLIDIPRTGFSWMHSHAANPFAVPLTDSLLRIYFTTRDEYSRSHVVWADVDINFDVTQISQRPVIEPGTPGCFDDSGAAMGCYLEVMQHHYIFYLGWNLKITVPWQNSIGLAMLDNSTGLFHKTSRAPLLDRSDEDPFSISYPSVLFEDGMFRMWYGSNLAWGKDETTMDHVIKYAYSRDGKNWTRTNKICIDLHGAEEYAIARPCVLKIDGLYRMWYSYRGSRATKGYRIGYAESMDGLTWNRKDDRAGIDVSKDGWDSEMICYANVFFFRNKFYMLYNGNGYGKTGFGLAIEDGRF
ncbi:MAG TPA: hypothetical protein VGD40_01380 [Chryseosolibacter sp.]